MNLNKPEYIANLFVDFALIVVLPFIAIEIYNTPNAFNILAYSIASVALALSLAEGRQR